MLSKFKRQRIDGHGCVADDPYLCAWREGRGGEIRDSPIAVSIFIIFFVCIYTAVAAKEAAHESAR